MMKPARKIYEWASRKVHSRFAPLWLAVIFLLEILLFLPLDGLLMLFCIEKREKRFVFAAIAALSSTVSGIIGFLLGYLLWDTIGPFVTTHLLSPHFFERLTSHYTLYQNWAVFIGSMLPIPFKAVALSAGFCQLSIVPFIFSILAARLLRFFGVALLMQFWGAECKNFIDKHFSRIVVALGAKIALTFTFFWALGY